MKEYDFTTVMDRLGHDAIAVDVSPIDGAKAREGRSILPMWVADMNFPVCPSIYDSVKGRLDDRHFGYFAFPQSYYDAIINWQKIRNHFDVRQEWIGYENGVLGGVASALSAFTLPGEPILVHSPTYIGFDHVFHDTGRVPVHSPLILQDGKWVMDYEDMEEKIRKHHIHTVIFNTPHNPTGRVWEKDEVEKAMEIFKKYDCLVISDEIWSDLILPGHHHIPPISVSEDAASRTIALYAPSKTFSLAGLVGSYHIIPNETLRTQLNRASAATHYNNGNILSVYALQGGYTQEGMDWVDQLMKVIETNENLVQDFFANEVKGVRFGKPEGTYMLYLDFSEWLKDNDMSMDELLKKGVEEGVYWQDGRHFMLDNTIRLNTALPTSMVLEAIDRLRTSVFC